MNKKENSQSILVVVKLNSRQRQKQKRGRSIRPFLLALPSVLVHTWKFATEVRQKQKRRLFRRASACASDSVFMVHTRT